MRCRTDKRPCEYLLRLIWKDDSSRRGVKHGRGTIPEVSFVDPIPSKDLITAAQWKVPEYRRIHFLNTTRADIEKTTIQAVARIIGIDRRPPTPYLYRSVQTLDLSTLDGVLFQYCK